MNSTQDLFNELTHLTQLYLLQEYKTSDWINSDADTYTYFKQLASTHKKTLPKVEPILEIKPLKEDPPIPIANATAIEKDPKALKLEPLKLEPLKLEPMASPKKADFSEIKSLLQEKYPHLEILEEATEAQQKTKAVAILSISADPLERKFLNNLAKAIEVCFASVELINAKSVESNQRWVSFLNQSQLKLIIINPDDLEKLPELNKHFKPTPSPELNKIPILTLPAFSTVLQDPSQKKLLWLSIESHFLANPNDEIS